MVRKVKFPLEMADGVQVRNLEALKENFDVEKVIAYFLDGKLQTWLADRYYEEEAESVAALSKDDGQLGKKLSEIFGIECSEEVDIEEISWKNERLAKIKQLTDDDEIIKNADYVAFNQEELAELYDEGVERIYLCEGEFTIPKSKQDLEYIEFGGAKVMNRKPKPEKSEVKSEITEPLTEEEVFKLVKENIGRYIVTPDNRVVYSVITQSDYEKLYIKSIDGNKQILSNSDTLGIGFIFADNDKVVWLAKDPINSRELMICASYFNNEKEKKLCHSNDFDGYEIIAIYQDWFWFTKDRKLYVINMRDDTAELKISEDVYMAQFEEGKIYFMQKDSSTITGIPAEFNNEPSKLYTVSIDGSSIDFITTLNIQNKGFLVKYNKLFYADNDKLSYADNEFKCDLCMIDLESRRIKKLGMFDNLTDPLSNVIFMKVDDTYIHYGMCSCFDLWFKSEVELKSKYKVKYNELGIRESSNIRFTFDDRIDNKNVYNKNLFKLINDKEK